MRPLASVAGTRCTRCTPHSYFSRRTRRVPDLGDDFLEAAGLALAFREHLDLPAMQRGVALSTCGRDRRRRAPPRRRLVPARISRMALCLVVGILRQQQQPDLLRQRLDLGIEPRSRSSLRTAAAISRSPASASRPARSAEGRLSAAPRPRRSPSSARSLERRTRFLAVCWWRRSSDRDLGGGRRAGRSCRRREIRWAASPAFRRKSRISRPGPRPRKGVSPISARPRPRRRPASASAMSSAVRPRGASSSSSTALSRPRSSASSIALTGPIEAGGHRQGAKADADQRHARRDRPCRQARRRASPARGCIGRPRRSA